MKISLNWVKDYINVKSSVDKIAGRLTMAGLEVERIHKAGSDSVFECEVTPNRADCLSMIGVARELGAIFDVAKKIPAVKVIKSSIKRCDIKILASKECLRYVGTKIEGVRVKPSSSFIQTRIKSVGLKPINNVVDVTNFCLMETGQPLHAFDYDKLEGGKIVVRFAKKGETITTIDSIKRTLDPSVLVIADAKKPVAIAGIMGGKNTEVTSSTKNILLESAYFNPVLIRRTSRKIGLSSDSSYRFERSVDIQGVDVTAQRAVDLILKEAAGHVAAHTKVSGVIQKTNTTAITISVEEINSRLGSSLTPAQCVRILKRLDFKVVTSSRALKVTVPVFRPDIKESVDITEEIARIVGYDSLPSELPQIKASTLGNDKRVEIRKQIRLALNGNSFDEAVTFTMINRDALSRSAQGNLKGIKIKNPLSADNDLMRPSMLSSLLPVAATNINRGQADVKFFEISKVYAPDGEREALALLATGTRTMDWRVLKKQAVDFYDLKGAVECALASIGFEDVSFERSSLDYFEGGIQANVFVGKKNVGTIGAVSPAVSSAFGIKQKEILFAQIDLEPLYNMYKPKRSYEAVTGYPSVTRDISIAIKKDVNFADVRSAAYELGGGLLTSVTFTEEYLGDKIAPDQRGLVFSLNYSSKRRTLREDEVNEVHSKILDVIVQKFDAIIR